MIGNPTGQRIGLADNAAKVYSTTEIPIGDVLARVLACPFLRQSQSHHL